jgi:hypothetical protein
MERAMLRVTAGEYPEADGWKKMYEFGYVYPKI